MSETNRGSLRHGDPEKSRGVKGVKYPLFSMDTVDVGLDWGRPVASDYSNNVFTGGSLNSVLVELGKEEPATEEHVEQQYKVAMARQ